jgi:uncharacterized repeat protein (TIGR01451 family)
MSRRSIQGRRALLSALATAALITAMLLPATSAQAGPSKLYSMTVSPSTAIAGQSTMFTVTVKNQTPGNSNANSFFTTVPFAVTGSVTATLVPPPAPPGSTNANASATVQVVGSRVNVRTIDPLKNNQVVVLHITATPAAGSCGSSSWAPDGTAVFTGSSLSGNLFSLTGPSPTTTVTCNASLSVTKTAVASSVSAGDDAAFDITVSNASGAATASNVGVSDSLPSGLTWGIDSQGLNGATNGTACTDPIVGGLLSCTIPTLTGGSHYTVRVSATTSALGTITNNLVTVSLNGETAATAGPASVSVVPGPPATLTFTTQPANTLVDDCINRLDCQGSGGVVVQVEDALGNAVVDGTNVTMSLGVDPTGVATLGGTLTQGTSGGTATFSDLTIDTTSSGYVLHAETTGSVSADSDEFAITNTNASCGGAGEPACTATFPGGGTVSAPAGTELIIETNSLECSGVQDEIAGTVTINPSGSGVIQVEFTDTIPLPVAGPFPFCKSPPEPPATVPLCNTIPNGFNQDPDGVPCLVEQVEFTGSLTEAILHSTLFMDSTDPHARH